MRSFPPICFFLFLNNEYTLRHLKKKGGDEQDILWVVHVRNKGSKNKYMRIFKKMMIESVWYVKFIGSSVNGLTIRKWKHAPWKWMSRCISACRLDNYLCIHFCFVLHTSARWTSAMSKHAAKRLDFECYYTDVLLRSILHHDLCLRNSLGRHYTRSLNAYWTETYTFWALWLALAGLWCSSIEIS